MRSSRTRGARCHSRIVEYCEGEGRGEGRKEGMVRVEDKFKPPTVASNRALRVGHEIRRFVDRKNCRLQAMDLAARSCYAGDGWRSCSVYESGDSAFPRLLPLSYAREQTKHSRYFLFVVACNEALDV